MIYILACFSTVLIVIIVVVIALCYLNVVFKAKKPRLYGKPGSDLRLRAQETFTFLSEYYYPPFWAQNGILMAIIRRFQSIPDLPFSREIVDFPDGGIAAIDWLHPPSSKDDATILILLPGVVGHTYDGPYLINPTKEALQKGWRVLILNRRGLDLPLKSPKVYCADNSEDLLYVLDIVALRYPNAKKIGCGFSMGGMILMNYLAKRTSDTSLLDIGISISAPFDGAAAADSMMSLFPRIFVLPWLVKSLVRSVLPHEEVLKERVDYEILRKVRTIRDFEGCFTAPLAGFEDLDEYYRATALHNKVHKIPIPFLVLTSEDDCFVPMDHVPLDTIEETENVICVVTAHGGHTAFMESSDVNASGLVEKVVFSFAEIALDSKMM